jgi:hypothetical protein
MKLRTELDGELGETLLDATGLPDSVLQTSYAALVALGAELLTDEAKLRWSRSSSASTGLRRHYRLRIGLDHTESSSDAFPVPALLGQQLLSGTSLTPLIGEPARNHVAKASICPARIVR